MAEANNRLPLDRYGFPADNLPFPTAVAESVVNSREREMRVGIAADHGGFGMKEGIIVELLAAGHQVVDFGAEVLRQGDDYPDFVVPLARALAAGQVERGVAVCGSGVGASVCANKIPGIRAALIHEHFSAHQGVEDDHLNMICIGGRTVGLALAWELVQTFLAAEFSVAERHSRRLSKVASLEMERIANCHNSETDG